MKEIGNEEGWRDTEQCTQSNVTELFFTIPKMSHSGIPHLKYLIKLKA